MEKVMNLSGEMVQRTPEPGSLWMSEKEHLRWFYIAQDGNKAIRLIVRKSTGQVMGIDLEGYINRECRQIILDEDAKEGKQAVSDSSSLLIAAWNRWTISGKAADARKSCSGEHKAFLAGAEAMVNIAHKSDEDIQAAYRKQVGESGRSVPQYSDPAGGE